MAERINLDNLVSSVVHSHYYMKVDGSEAGNAKYVRQVERDKGVYSSPRNIRKLFLKHTGVEAIFYRPLVGKKELAEIVKYKDVDKNLLIKSFKEYVMEFSGNMVGADRVIISGTGFNSFYTDLSVSNLEELYFDWSLLLGNKELFGEFMRFQGQGIVGARVVAEELYMDPITVRKQKTQYVKADTLDGTSWNAPGSRELASKMIAYITQCMCGNKKGGLQANFPRLKYIGFIGSPQVKLSSDGGITKESLKAYDRRAIYNFYQPNQLNQVFGAGISNMFMYSIFVDTGADMYSQGFRVDAGLYQYDADILEDYFKCTTVKEMTREYELTKWFTEGVETRLGVESKLWWVKQLRAGQLMGQKSAAKSLEGISKGLAKKEETKEVQDKLDSTPRNSLESTWNALYKKEGKTSVEFTMNCLRLQMDSSIIKKTIEEFSPAGREFYMNIFNNLKD